MPCCERVQIGQADREPDSMESGQLWKWRVLCNLVARLSMRPHVVRQGRILWNVIHACYIYND